MSFHTAGMAYHLGGVPLGDSFPIMRQDARYYFVDGKLGSDNRLQGRKFDEPYATIATAITAMNARIDWSASPWARADVLVISPGVYAENLTALPYGCTIIGLGDAFDLNGERGVTIKPAAGSPLDATSVINMRIHNICFESPDTAPCFEADNFNRNIFTKILFAGNTGDTTTNCFEVVKDMTGNRLANCIFHRGAYGMFINTDNANQKQASGNIIEDSYVTGCTTAGIYFDINCVPSFTVINRCNVGDGSTTLALGLDDNTGQVGVFNTNFQATACDPASGDGDSKYNNCYLNGALMT